jgi:Flp pilus assembly protein TadD
MKTVCPICKTRKAKRVCAVRELAEICPLCCAGARDAACAGCVHYTTAQAYREKCPAISAQPDGHYMVEINPEVERAVNQTLMQAQRKGVDPARKTLERLLREHPRNHTVLFGMGVLHLMQDERREAIPWFDQATAICPYFVEAHFNKALACQQEGDVAGAVRAYRKVVEFGNRQDDEVQKARKSLVLLSSMARESEQVDLDTYVEAQERFQRAFALLEAGSFEEALAGFRTAAAKSDRNAPTHGNMALCLARLGRKAEALKEIGRALEINPHYSPAMLNRVAVERMEEGKPIKGVEFARTEFSKE